MPARTSLNYGIAISVLVALFGIGQFIWCTSRAMDLYEGGNFENKDSSRYEWKLNWLSDLGRTVAISGRANQSSSLYFNGGVKLLGVCLIVFFLNMYRNVDEKDLTTWVTQLGGVFAALGLIGIGLTPVDMYYDLHHVALVMWLVPMPVIAIVFGIQCINSDNSWLQFTRWWFLLAAFILTAAIMGYAIAGTRTGYVQMQKVVVGCSITWFGILSARIAVSAVEVVARTKLEFLADQAGQYEAKLKRGHLKRRTKYRDDT